MAHLIGGLFFFGRRLRLFVLTTAEEVILLTDFFLVDKGFFVVSADLAADGLVAFHQ